MLRARVGPVPAAAWGAKPAGTDPNPDMDVDAGSLPRCLAAPCVRAQNGAGRRKRMGSSGSGGSLERATELNSSGAHPASSSFAWTKTWEVDASTTRLARRAGKRDVLAGKMRWQKRCAGKRDALARGMRWHNADSADCGLCLRHAARAPPDPINRHLFKTTAMAPGYDDEVQYGSGSDDELSCTVTVTAAKSPRPGTGVEPVPFAGPAGGAPAVGVVADGLWSEDQLEAEVQRRVAERLCAQEQAAIDELASQQRGMAAVRESIQVDMLRGTVDSGAPGGSWLSAALGAVNEGLEKCSIAISSPAAKASRGVRESAVIELRELQAERERLELHRANMDDAEVRVHLVRVA